MRVLFYLGHPAHFHLFRNVVEELRRRGHQIEVLIKKKEMLEELVREAGWSYRNILKRGRRSGNLGIAWGLAVREWRLFRIAREARPDLMLGTSAEIPHVGRLLDIPSVVVNEDDYDVIPKFARVAYPFADAIVAPRCCRMGRWAHKAVTYDGYQELAYLHPNHFVPNERTARDLAPNGGPYFILRFVSLEAHHDVGRRGIDALMAEKLIHLLQPHGPIYITSERPLEPQFEPYRMPIHPLEIHHALYYAGLYIGDSQTMAAEAAVLGTPSVRFNDFVGEIGYLEELEHRYGLTTGIRTSQPERLVETVRELLETHDRKAIWAKRRGRMLAEKIDVAAFLTSFVEQYPHRQRGRRKPTASPAEASTRTGIIAP